MNISQIKNNNKLKIKETHVRNHIPGFSIQSVGISILHTLHNFISMVIVQRFPITRTRMFPLRSRQIDAVDLELILQ